jgi:HEAT repeat protein
VSASAAEALKRLQPTRELAGALQDRSPAVRLKAAQALAASGGRANGPLLIGLLGDEDYEVRRVAIKALASDDLATSDNLAALAAALRDRDVQKRLGALTVLGQVAARPSHPPLPRIDDALAESMTHPAADVRAEAVRTAGSMRDPRWLGPLVEAARDPAPHVRQTAAEALVNVPSPQAVEALRHLMNDEVPDVRLAALASLRRLNLK